jgi:glycosyltransferase involved in cell wall biosynthesis
MLQTYNEQRLVGACIEHLREQGVDVYLIDNESTDETVAIAERYLGNGLVGIETLPRDGSFALRAQCARQEELAQTLDADWLIHYDADEFRTSTKQGQSLADAIREADEAGFNAIDFHEFVFVPTQEFPDHDHPDFRLTMRRYYFFQPTVPHRCNAWKKQEGPVELAWSGGHVVRFPGLNMAPEPLNMRHYLFLSVPHAIEKFVERRFAEDEVADGWFGWRATIAAGDIVLPHDADLRFYVADHLLDASSPRDRHVLDPAALV